MSAPLVVVDVYLDFLGFLGFARSKLYSLEIGPNHIILFANWNALREFSVVIGKNLPRRLSISNAPNLDFDPVNGAVIGTPHGPKY